MAEDFVPTRQWFRVGVGAVIVGEKGVLAFERRDRPGSWQLPQGGVKHGETLEKALFREIKEETGLKKNDVEILTDVPQWLGYELPKALRSVKTQRGQVHRWFFLKLRTDTSRITLRPKGEFRAWEWRDLRTLAESVVDFRRPVYRHLAEFAAKERLME